MTPRPLNLTLPSFDAPEHKRYAMPDPDVLLETYDSVRVDAFPFIQSASTETVTVNARELRRVLMLANGYLELTMSDYGQEQSVSKLRDVWRARRGRVNSDEKESER